MHLNPVTEVVFDTLLGSPFAVAKAAASLPGAPHKTGNIIQNDIIQNIIRQEHRTQNTEYRTQNTEHDP
jgi:hypothetical protein